MALINTGRGVPAALALIIACAASGCRAQAVGDSFYYNGSINKAGAASISEAIQAGAKTLHITSAGGDASLAIPLAFLIRERGVRVIASQYCVSACAEYILPAGTGSQVEGNTVLGFHNTVSSMELVASTMDPEAAERIYGPLAREERRLYALLGIEEAFLFVPTGELGPMCSGFTRSAPDRIDAFLVTRIVVFAPSPRRLESAGFRLNWLLPTRPLDQGVAVRSQRSGLEHASWKIERDDSPGMTREVAVDAIKAVPQCSPEMRATMHIPPV